MSIPCFLRAGLLCAALAGLTGCMRDESIVSVRKDGSGTIEETLLITGAAKDSMEGMLNQFGDALAKGFGATNTATNGVTVAEDKSAKKGMFDKASFEKRAKSLGEGVTVTGYEETKDAEGFSGVKVTYAFQDIRKLKYHSDKDLTMPGSEASSDEAGKKDEPPVTFELKGNTLVIHHPKPEAKKSDKPADPEAQKQAEAMEAAAGQMMAGMLRGAKVRLIIRVPGGIASTDASFVKDNDITLAAVNMDEIAKDPEGIKKLNKISENAATPEELKGIPGVTMEPKDTVTVQMK